MFEEVSIRYHSVSQAPLHQQRLVQHRKKVTVTLIIELIIRTKHLSLFLVFVKRTLRKTLRNNCSFGNCCLSVSLPHPPFPSSVSVQTEQNICDNFTAVVVVDIVLAMFTVAVQSL